MRSGPTVDEMLSLLAGEVSPDVLAARHGLSLDELACARRWYVAGLRRPRTRRGLRLAVMAVAACLALFLAPLALGQSCPQTLPAPLVTMCPDAPALANEVNGNFGQVVTWLQQKVGPVGSQNVTVNGTLTANGAVAVTGAVSATSVSALTTISTSGLLSATSLNVSAAINAGSISPSTVVPGAVLGGGTVRCNGNSSIRRDCAAWGVASCPANCGSLQCSRGTARGIADGSCFTAADGQGGYCYHVLCVQ